MNTEFRYRLDFYWKAISFYAVALIAYAMVRGLRETWTSGRLELALLDPLLILLFAFVLGSTITLGIAWFMQRSITIGENEIVLRNRFRERHIPISDILRIGIGREKIFKVRGAFKVVKIRLNSRRRLLRIRTSSFNEEQELVQALRALRARIQSPEVR